MKFLVIEIQTNKDGSVGNFVFAYESELEARSKYHAVLSAAATSTIPVHAAVLLTSDGSYVTGERFEHGEGA